MTAPLTPLAPCPFCAGAAEVVRATYDDAAEYAHVMCIECEATSACYASEAEAISAWNRRAPALRWRSEPPDVSGWWLWRSQRGVVGILTANGATQLAISARRRLDGYRWAGPISEPEEGA